MRKTVRLGLAWVLGGGGGAVACPDLGVAVKVNGDKNYADLDVRVRAMDVWVKTSAGHQYTFRWKGTMEKGQWCYDTLADGKTATVCQKSDTINEEVPVHRKNGDIVAVVRMYGKPTTLARTRKTGALLAIVQNGQPDPETIDYQSPWLRFVYSVELKPATLTTNDISEVNAALRKARVTKDAAAADYALTHHMYVDYFDRGGRGFSPLLGDVKGTLTVDKTEVPLASLPRDLPNSVNADLDGNHWQGKANASGCQTSIEKR